MSSQLQTITSLNPKEEMFMVYHCRGIGTILKSGTQFNRVMKPLWQTWVLQASASLQVSTLEKTCNTIRPPVTDISNSFHSSFSLVIKVVLLHFRYLGSLPQSTIALNRSTSLSPFRIPPKEVVSFYATWTGAHSWSFSTTDLIWRHKTEETCSRRRNQKCKDPDSL